MDHDYPSGLGIDLDPSETAPSPLTGTPHSTDTGEINSCISICGTSAKSLPATPAPWEVSEPDNRNMLAGVSLTGDFTALQGAPPSLGQFGGPGRPGNTLDDWSIWTDLDIATILGDSNSRLKAGAKIFPLRHLEDAPIFLEKAKRQPRVDVDIFLKSDICVHGGFLEGSVRVNVKRRSCKSQPVLLCGGKIRLLGFEALPKDEKRFVFYQCSRELSDVAGNGLDMLYRSEPDVEGYCHAKEGIFTLPFTLHLNHLYETGTPKGYISLSAGPSVRYIAIVSLRIKKPVSGKKSVAHFYRECAVWPRLRPDIILTPESRPIQLTVSEDSFSAEGKVFLTASLHRLYWIAGQLCHVKIKVANGSKKRLKTISLGLIQNITTFKERTKSQSHSEPRLDSACTSRETAQSTLTAGEKSTRGHASANGWWLGVPAGETETFMHSIRIPEDALSIPGGVLFEISYTLKVTVHTKSFLPTDLYVSLPIEIVNSISIDPPPTCSRIGDMHTDMPFDDGEASTPEQILGARSTTGSSRCQSPYSSDSGGPEENDGSDDNDLSASDSSISQVTRSLSHERPDNEITAAENHAEQGESALRFSDLYFSNLPSKMAADRQGQVTGFADRVEQKMAELKSAADHGNRKDHQIGTTPAKPAAADFSDVSGFPSGCDKGEILPAAESMPRNGLAEGIHLSMPAADRLEVTVPSSTVESYIGASVSHSSLPRHKSVKEKIRELEELAARS